MHNSSEQFLCALCKPSLITLTHYRQTSSLSYDALLMQIGWSPQRCFRCLQLFASHVEVLSLKYQCNQYISFTCHLGKDHFKQVCMYMYIIHADYLFVWTTACSMCKSDASIIFWRCECFNYFAASVRYCEVCLICYMLMTLRVPADWTTELGKSRSNRNRSVRS